MTSFVDRDFNTGGKINRNVTKIPPNPRSRGIFKILSNYLNDKY